MSEEKLIPHLFRTEYRKIAAVLSRLFGLEHMHVAEDIASETFTAALETWPYKGVPENPTAWLYSVAKNKTKNYLNRNRTFAQKITPKIRHTAPVSEEFEIDLSERNITDSQLQMLFAICHPSIQPEAQISLALRVLCGFGIQEIANALLTNKDTIEKRLYRAKEKLKIDNVAIEMPGEHNIGQRLDNVLTTLYLLFNEGYYSESSESVLREELCLEAMRLVFLLVENESTKLPKVYALLALMCFHASRFKARKNATGEIILYQQQDETLWDYELIAKGAWFLNSAAVGEEISKYHLEASIAYWHTQKDDTVEKWENILQLFNRLLQIEYSPIAALNRTFALAKARGKEQAIAEAEKLNLTNNHYYFMLLGELYSDTDKQMAKLSYTKALTLATTHADKLLVQKKMGDLKTL